MNRTQCKTQSVPKLREMCRNENVANFSGKNKDWLVLNCCLDIDQMNKSDLYTICRVGDIHGYTKLSTNALREKCKTIQQCDRKSSVDLRKMCSEKNASYGGMNKDEMKDWCCLDLEDTFGKMTPPNIKKYLKENGAKGYSSLNKDDLVINGVATEECRRKGVIDLRKMCKSNKVKKFSGLSKMQMVNDCCVPFVSAEKMSAMERMAFLYPNIQKETPKKDIPKEEKIEYDIWASEEKIFDKRG